MAEAMVHKDNIRADAHGEVVLLIEDDDDIATMYAFGLSLRDHPVHIATSGHSGLEEAIVEQKPPSVIVLDLCLPDMPGLELLDNLRLHTPPIDIPVIVLSNDTTSFDAAYEHGATECHPKYRTTPLELVDYVEAALRRAG